MTCTNTYFSTESNSYITEINPQTCPVPKMKGIYYPTQDQYYKQITAYNCNIVKIVPGNPSNSIPCAMRVSNILSSGALGGKTHFVVNGGTTGTRAGQPGGIQPPLRNRF